MTPPNTPATAPSTTPVVAPAPDPLIELKKKIQAEHPTASKDTVEKLTQLKSKAQIPTQAQGPSKSVITPVGRAWTLDEDADMTHLNALISQMRAEMIAELDAGNPEKLTALVKIYQTEVVEKYKASPGFPSQDFIQQLGIMGFMDIFAQSTKYKLVFDPSKASKFRVELKIQDPKTKNVYGEKTPEIQEALDTSPPYTIGDIQKALILTSMETEWKPEVDATTGARQDTIHDYATHLEGLGTKNKDQDSLLALMKEKSSGFIATESLAPLLSDITKVRKQVENMAKEMDGVAMPIRSTGEEVNVGKDQENPESMGGQVLDGIGSGAISILGKIGTLTSDGRDKFMSSGNSMLGAGILGIAGILGLRFLGGKGWLKSIGLTALFGWIGTMIYGSNDTFLPDMDGFNHLFYGENNLAKEAKERRAQYSTKQNELANQITQLAQSEVTSEENGGKKYANWILAHSGDKYGRWGDQKTLTETLKTHTLNQDKGESDDKLVGIYVPTHLDINILRKILVKVAELNTSNENTTEVKLGNILGTLQRNMEVSSTDTASPETSYQGA